MKKLSYSLLSICLLFTIVGCGKKSEEIKLKKEEFTIEYGDKISMKPSTYLDTNISSILDSAKVSFNDYKSDEEKNYPAVGAYMGEITYTEDKKEKTKKLVVRVKDTVAPKFEDFKDTIHLVKGTIDSDLRRFFFARDLSAVTIHVDASKVNFANEGEYEIVVTATDEHGNKTKKDAKVIIKAEDKNTTITPDPVYACPDALYNKDKVCSYIPENKLFPEPYINFESKEEWETYIAENQLEQFLSGYYEVKNNGKESIMIWYVNPTQPTLDNPGEDKEPDEAPDPSAEEEK